MSTRYLCGILMVVFLAIAAVISIFSLRNANESDLLTGKLNGESAQAYEEEFDNNLAHRDASVKLWNSVGYVLFGEGAEGVLIGREGWLFTHEEFLYGEDFAANLKRNKDYILEVSWQLTSENIRLIILPLPSKARVYKNKLGRYAFPTLWKNQYEDLIQFLRTHDLIYTDILSIYVKVRQNSLFLKTDTHWTPLGARLAAMKVGSVVQREFPYLSWDNIDYKSARAGKIVHEGDLMRYTVTGRDSRIFGLEKDRFYKWHTERKGEANNDFLGDPALPIALVGTSYSANPLWNFQGFLKEFLGSDILNVADEGLGPFETMHKYLGSEAYEKSKPKLVVWEIPERYIGMTSSFMKEQK